MKDDQILDSWKEISDYLGRSRKTCLRWEKELGLPIHRYEDSPKARVFANKSEIDLWREKTRHSDKKPFNRKSITKRLFIPAFVIAIAILIIVILIEFSVLPRRHNTINSIAVLAFKDLSPQKDQEYFCDGLAESLINALTKIRELRVPARTSSFSFRNQEQDLFEIGEKLNVKTVLEGSVQIAENRLRVTVKLVDITDESILWSEQYNRERDDIFAIQDEITFAIVNQLKINLVGEERTNLAKRYTENIEAYDSYLRGLWIVHNTFSEEDYRTAITHYERTKEIDSNFSLAYVELARVYMQLAAHHYIPSDEALLKIKEELQQALKIDNTLAEALGLLGFMKFRFERDWRGGKADLKRALELNPNDAWNHVYYSYMLLIESQFDEAIKERLIALDLDPLSLRIKSTLGWIQYQARRFDDAIEQCEKVIELDPDYGWTYVVLGRCYVQKSLFRQAIQAFEKAQSYLKNSTENLSLLAYGYAASGDTEKALEILEELEKFSEHKYVSSVWLAIVYAALGEIDEAFEYLEIAHKEKDNDLPWLRIDPAFDPLRSDPRFESMLKRIGLEK